jgi:hypothetical protein
MTTIVLFFVVFLLNAAISVWFVRLQPTLTIPRLLAVSTALITVVAGLVFSVVFIRIFRRNPSVSVFLVTLSFTLVMVDGVKLVQIIAIAEALPRVSALASRMIIGGHLAWIAALSGAGLYSGGVRMQRHGVAIAIVLAICTILAGTVPIETEALPDNLVHATGLRSSVEVVVAILGCIAVINYVFAAISDRSARRLLSALAIALIVVGREGLFYSIEPVVVLVSCGMFVAGAIVFASQHYREQMIG